MDRYMALLFLLVNIDFITDICSNGDVRYFYAFIYII